MKFRNIGFSILLVLGAVWFSSCSDSKDVNPLFTDMINTAKSGDADAQYEMAVLLERGWLEQSDGAEEDSERWYKKAAEQGHVNAQYALGDKYNYQRIYEKSKVKKRIGAERPAIG